MNAKSKTVMPISPSGWRLTPQNAGAAVALLTALYWVTNHPPKGQASTALQPALAPAPSPSRVSEVVRPEEAGALVAGGRPFGMDAFRLQSLLLRVGLAFVFLYASLSAFVDPLRFSGYMPAFLPPAFVERVCLPCFSAYEAVLAACFLAGRRLLLVSSLSALTLLGILVLNPDKFSVLFRNVAVIGAALAVAIQAWSARGAGEPLTAPSERGIRRRLRRSQTGPA